MVLYGTRAARKGLLRAANNLPRFINRWSLECDIKLKRLMDYNHSTYHWREANWIGDDIEDISIHVYPDADLAVAKPHPSPLVVVSSVCLEKLAIRLSRLQQNTNCR